MRKRRRSIGILIVLSACAAFLSYELLLRIHYELSGVLADDALIYLAVGRGILHGLTPYIDLFETKPPGIFLLNAGSLMLTGDVGPLKVLQVIALLSIAGIVPLGTWPHTKNMPRAERAITTVLALVMGLLMSLYTATMAGEGQVESFGAALTLLVLLGLILSTKSWWGFSAIAAAMAAAIGMKEPFLFSVIAGAIILQVRYRNLAITLALTFVLGLIALIILGYLIPYLTVYLPHMIGTHAVAHNPLWMRVFAIHRLLGNITAFSLFLMLAVVTLWVGVLWGMVHETRDRERWMQLASFGVALLLVLSAIGLGGDFYGHHFIFAVPFLVACFWKFVQSAERNPGASLRIYMTLLVVLLLGATVVHTRPDYADAKYAWEERKGVLIQTAQSIDMILDRCGWERYLHLIPKGGGPFAYTRHPPYGPVFTQYSRFMGFESSPFIEPFKKTLLHTEIILITDLEKVRMTEIAKRYIQANFGAVPPLCADAVDAPGPYTLLFRFRS